MSANSDKTPSLILPAWVSFMALRQQRVTVNSTRDLSTITKPKQILVPQNNLTALPRVILALISELHFAVI